MKAYHFDCGNSNQGPLGLCAEVLAETREQAVLKLRTALEDRLGPLGVLRVHSGGSPTEYINVYVNPDYIGAWEIDEEEQRDSAR